MPTDTKSNDPHARIAKGIDPGREAVCASALEAGERLRAQLPWNVLRAARARQRAQLQAAAAACAPALAKRAVHDPLMRGELEPIEAAYIVEIAGASTKPWKIAGELKRAAKAGTLEIPADFAERWRAKQSTPEGIAEREGLEAQKIAFAEARASKRAGSMTQLCQHLRHLVELGELAVIEAAYVVSLAEASETPRSAGMLTLEKLQRNGRRVPRDFAKRWREQPPAEREQLEADLLALVQAKAARRARHLEQLVEENRRRVRCGQLTELEADYLSSCATNARSPLVDGRRIRAALADGTRTVPSDFARRWSPPNSSPDRTAVLIESKEGQEP